jgi:hypothetical protein
MDNKQTVIGITDKPEEAGIKLAHHFDWDGLQLLKITYAALEDSNFHKENETIMQLIKNIENEKQ